MVAYLEGVWRCRYFWLSLVFNDLRARYKRSVLGIGWSLLQPLGMSIILCVVFGTIFNQNIIFYGPYLLAGLTFWNYMMQVSSQGCRCFFEGESYIRQFPAPMAIYPLRTTLGASFHFVLGLVLVVLLTTILRAGGSRLGFPDSGPILPNIPALLSLIPTSILLLVFGWSLATIFGLMHVRFRDTLHITEIGLQALFYLTPVMFTPKLLEGHETLTRLVQLNPLTPIVTLIRAPFGLVVPVDPLNPDLSVAAGHVPSLALYATVALTVLLTTLLASVMLKQQERKIIFCF